MIPVKPKDCTWTDEQWIAIHDSGKNILVSAGAGSGKTAVLKERVLNKLKNGVSLKNLVILTFTKAAAAEMKERIRKALLEDEKLKDQARYQTVYCKKEIKHVHMESLAWMQKM